MQYITFFFIFIFVYKKDKNKLSLKLAFETGFSLVDNQVNFVCIRKIGIKDQKALKGLI